MFQFKFNGRTYTPLFPDILRPLSFEERQDLEASVKARGVQVPVLVDEHDRIIDGLHRCLTAEGCGLAEVPVRVVAGLTPEEKYALAFEVNDCRRQQTPHELGPRRKTRAEKRAAIAAEVIRTPEMSDRAIAEKVKEKTGEPIGKNTVARVRTQLVQNKETDQLPRTRGQDGKERPARRPQQETPAVKPAAPKPAPVAPRSEPEPPRPPKPRRPTQDEIADRLSGPKSQLEQAAAAVRMVLSGGGDPALIPGRLEGVNEVLAAARSAITEVVAWLRSL